jgi:hypothetical protein
LIRVGCVAKRLAVERTALLLGFDGPRVWIRAMALILLVVSRCLLAGLLRRRPSRFWLWHAAFVATRPKLLAACVRHTSLSHRW